MSTIIARIKLAPGESVLDFKHRVSLEYGKLCDDLYPKHPERQDWVLSRMTEDKDGGLLNDFSWGEAFPELPAEECCIAWLNPQEKRCAKVSVNA